MCLFSQAEPSREKLFHNVLLTSRYDTSNHRQSSGRTSWNVDLKLGLASTLCT